MLIDSVVRESSRCPHPPMSLAAHGHCSRARCAVEFMSRGGQKLNSRISKVTQWMKSTIAASVAETTQHHAQETKLLSATPETS